MSQVIDDFVAAAPGVAAEMVKLTNGSPECVSIERVAEMLVKQTPDKAAFTKAVIAAFQAP